MRWEKIGGNAVRDDVFGIADNVSADDEATTVLLNIFMKIWGNFALSREQVSTP
jgi:hypothetical protein